MILLAIDPGNEKSAALLYDTDTKAVRPLGADLQNESLLGLLRSPRATSEYEEIVLEKMACYGMAVGKEVFLTVKWTGRFIEAWDRQGGKWHEVERKDVKMHLCATMRATDSNVMTALIDRYGPGREKAVGTKKAPGPLRGIATHLWAALGVAVTFADQQAAAASWQRKFERDRDAIAGAKA